MLFLYILGFILFFIMLRKYSTNPIWVDIILSILWFVCLSLILLLFLGLLIYNILYTEN